MGLFDVFRKPKAQTVTPKAMFDGAQAIRRLLNWVPANTGPRAQSYAYATLCGRARDLYRNNPLARAVVDRMVSDAVAGGVGCRPRAVLPDSLRRQMVADFEDWSIDSDADGLTDFYGLQESAFREMIIAGESLVLLEPMDTPCGVRLRWRLLEADHLPFGTHDLQNGHRLVDGIELDRRGQRVAYHLYRTHPGDGVANMADLRRIDAAQVLHLYTPRRPGQLRGESWLSPVLSRLKNLDDLNDAVLERQKLSNLFMAFIRKPAPEFDPNQTAEEPAPLNMEPGAVQELLPGEDMVFANPPGAEGYEGFTREHQRHIAGAMGVPYFLLSGDYSGINDRTARVELTAYRRRVLQWSRNTLIPRLVRPLREAWVKAAVLSGALPSTIALSDLLRTDYVPEAWQYIHPVQDVQAERLAIRAGLKSRAESLLERGRDIEEVDAARATDAQRESRLGLVNE